MKKIRRLKCLTRVWVSVWIFMRLSRVHFIGDHVAPEHPVCVNVARDLRREAERIRIVQEEKFLWPSQAQLQMQFLTHEALRANVSLLPGGPTGQPTNVWKTFVSNLRVVRREDKYRALVVLIQRHEGLNLWSVAGVTTDDDESITIHSGIESFCKPFRCPLLNQCVVANRAKRFESNRDNAEACHPVCLGPTLFPL